MLLLLEEIVHCWMNCSVKTFHQSCWICGKGSWICGVHMAALKCQLTLWAAGKNVNPSQSMQDLHYWVKMEKLHENGL